MLTGAYVLRPDDFDAPLRYQQTHSRYKATLLMTFVVVFSLLGPVIASASFGAWLRHAVYGLTTSVAIVVAVALLGAALADQQPFNMHKEAASTSIDLARTRGVPAAIVLGPIAGILIGRRLKM